MILLYMVELHSLLQHLCYIFTMLLTPVVWILLAHVYYQLLSEQQCYISTDENYNLCLTTDRITSFQFYLPHTSLYILGWQWSY